ncbi:MAG: hypothetical protein AB1801_09690 [Chloroflexota bacterium]
MVDHQPRIASLKPLVLADRRRVTMELVVEGLPAALANIFFMPDPSDMPSTRPVKPDPQAASPYPHIELSILNRRRQKLVDMFIVEHREPYLALTLHLPAPDPQEQYIARAEMTYNDNTLDVMETPFTLSGASDE